MRWARSWRSGRSWGEVGGVDSYLEEEKGGRECEEWECEEWEGEEG